MRYFIVLLVSLILSLVKKSDLLTIAAFPDWNPGHFLSVGEMSFAVAIG